MTMLKGLIFSSFALFATAASAELKELTDEDLSKIEGQSGLTIDLEIKLTIGEIAYLDSGHLVAQGVRLGGHGMDDGSHKTKRKR